MEKTLLAFNPATDKRESYLQLAVRTAAPLENGRMTAVHSMLGVCGELLEVYQLVNESPAFITREDFRKNLIAEVGDVFWYYALFYDWCYALPEEHFAKSVREAELQSNTLGLVRCADRLAALVKKEMAYGKLSSAADVQKLYETSMGILKYLLSSEGISVIEVLDANIAKLAARYPSGTFDVQTAMTHNGH